MKSTEIAHQLTIESIVEKRNGVCQTSCRDHFVMHSQP